MSVKVAFLIRDLEYGGAQRQLVTLLKGLKNTDLECSILYFYPGGPLVKDLEESNIYPICLNKEGRWDFFGFLRRTIACLREIQPDILHGYLGEANLVSIFLKPFFPKMKTIWGIRESSMAAERADWFGNALFLLDPPLSRWADLIIFNSQAGLQDYLRSGFPREKSIVIPNGIDTNRFQPFPQLRSQLRREWAIGDRDLLIGLVARLDVMKDHPNFLRAAARVCQNRGEVRFVCVGSGPQSYREELWQLTRDLNLEERIVWAGARADMPSVYNALDIACSASAYGEGFSNAIGEAMACGIPCIVTNIGDSAWIVGDTGFVVPPHNSDALAEAMEKAIADELVLTSSEIQRSRIVNLFSVERLVEQTRLALKG
jgi:glycosyltransferase involved in cell wall biosynthesis